MAGGSSPGLRFRDPQQNKSLGTEGISRKDKVSPKSFADFSASKKGSPSQSKTASLADPSPVEARSKNAEEDRQGHGCVMAIGLLGQPCESEVPSSLSLAPESRSGSRDCIDSFSVMPVRPPRVIKVTAVGG